MRVMFWCTVYWPHIGGIQTMANALLPALRERGHEILVIADQDPPDLPTEDEHQGIPIYRFPFAAGLRDIDRLTEIRGQLIRLKRAFAPHLCHTATLGTTDFYHHISAGACRTPVLVSLYGVWPRRYEQLLVRTFGSADWLTCDSASTLEYARRLMPAISPRSSVIRSALPPSSVAPEPLPDPPRLLYLGRLAPEKGVDLALLAFASIVKRNPGAHLVIAGDGPERDALEQQTIRCGLAEVVHFLGWVATEKVPALLNTASMLILPSRADSFPLAGLQASLMERPIVAARVGGIPERVVDRKTGLLVEKENTGALAEAISHLLDHPKDAARMGKAARKQILNNFRHDQYIDAYDRLYRRIVVNQRDGRRTGGTQR